MSTIYINPPFIFRAIHYFSSLLSPINSSHSLQPDQSTLLEKKGLHVMLADDDDDDRYFFAQAINEISGSVKLSMANDGTELLMNLKTAGAGLPDLIFLDLNMPRKNGLECLEELKQNLELKDIPVIIYSTSSHPQQVEDTYLRGANLFIQKPDSYGRIKDVLHRVFSLKRDELFKQADRTSFLMK